VNKITCTTDLYYPVRSPRRSTRLCLRQVLPKLFWMGSARWALQSLSSLSPWTKGALGFNWKEQSFGAQIEHSESNIHTSKRFPTCQICCGSPLGTEILYYLFARHSSHCFEV